MARHPYHLEHLKGIRPANLPSIGAFDLPSVNPRSDSDPMAATSDDDSAWVM
jgi:hypothetical protein